MDKQLDLFIKERMVDNKVEFTRDELAEVLLAFVESILISKEYIETLMGKSVPREEMLKVVKETIAEKL